ncbi:RmlC-like cupin [Favolaschia claudopus]|uniref:RmlC-like cupin n=1 Tax=Favolaschia claudopus TaxID=2862362 RepID=A0AAW0A052_9AGAR
MLSYTWAALALALASTLPAFVSADAKSDAADLVKKLRDAPTAVDRINLLASDDEFEFDFFDPKKSATVGAGGKIILANAGTFPAVIGTGSAMAIGILDACSMNTPHTHPRATEMQFSVNGTIRTGMITENNARFIMTDLPPGSMTIFPQGSIHFQFNDGCSPALFVASFNSEDPGALQIAQRFLGLPPDIVGATLGDLGVEQVAGLESEIPDNVALGPDACLKRCGLKRPEQPTLQRQPRVSGNAFPPQVSGYDKTASGTGNAGKNYGFTTKGYGGTTTTTSSYGAHTTSGYGNDNGSPSKGTNHLIKVGADGLRYSPSNISAAVGDTVTFEFHPKNHTVTQSSFLHPCTALGETSAKGEVGFKSGFKFVDPSKTSDFPTFSIIVNDTAPIWGYCPPIHCHEGMVFSINAVESGPNNFEAFQKIANNSAAISSQVDCPARDKDGTILTASGTTKEGVADFVDCTYPSAGHCSYFTNGGFDSGSSSCPAGIAQANRSALKGSKAAAGKGSLAELAEVGAGAAAGASPSSESTPNKSKFEFTPPFIALLAVNGVLLIALIVLAALYVRSRRVASRQRRHKTLYTSLGAGGDPIFVAPKKVTQYDAAEGDAPGDDTPLTHGLTHGPYYDPHEPTTPSRPASRLR